METVLVHALMAGAQVAAIGSRSPDFYWGLRKAIMPGLTIWAVYVLIQHGAPIAWIAPFLATGLLFAALPSSMPRPLWLPINIAVAALNLAYLGHIGWLAVLG